MEIQGGSPGGEHHEDTFVTLHCYALPSPLPLTAAPLARPAIGMWVTMYDGLALPEVNACAMDCGLVFPKMNKKKNGGEQGLATGGPEVDNITIASSPQTTSKTVGNHQSRWSKDEERDTRDAAGTSLLGVPCRRQ